MMAVSDETESTIQIIKHYIDQQREEGDQASRII